MGSDKNYPEEAPAHEVTVDGFWMDQHPVTNEHFRRFVEAAKHVTHAESQRLSRRHTGNARVCVGRFSNTQTTSQYQRLLPMVDLCSTGAIIKLNGRGQAIKIALRSRAACLR